MTFKHNDKVTCKINGDKITDAKISIDKDGTPFICQNEHFGFDAEDKLGYKYSWFLGGDFTHRDVTNLKLFTIEKPEPESSLSGKEVEVKLDGKTYKAIIQ